MDFLHEIFFENNPSIENRNLHQDNDNIFSSTSQVPTLKTLALEAVNKKASIEERKILHQKILENDLFLEDLKKERDKHLVYYDNLNNNKEVLDNTATYNFTKKKFSDYFSSYNCCAKYKNREVFPSDSLISKIEDKNINNTAGAVGGADSLISKIEDKNINNTAGAVGGVTKDSDFNELNNSKKSSFFNSKKMKSLKKLLGKKN